MNSNEFTILYEDANDMKKHYILFIAAYFLFTAPINAQVGCPSNFLAGIMKGADSTETHGDQTFKSLTVNPKNPNVVYIGTEGNGIFRTLDGGLTWHWLRNGMKHSSGAYGENYSVDINPEDTSELIMGFGASPGPAIGSPGAIYMTHNGGNNWVQRICGLENESVPMVWYDKAHPDTLLAASYGGYSSEPGNTTFTRGGVFRSVDKGLNWVRMNTPLRADTGSAVRPLMFGNNILVYWRGFMLSSDAGANWTYLPKPLFGRNIVEYASTPDLTSIYGLVRDSMVLYHTTDTGKSWLRKNYELNGMMSFYPGAPDTMFFDYGGVLVRSNNRLNNAFNSIDHKIVLVANKFIEKLVYAPSNPRIIYVSTRGYRVYKSTDGGHHFNLLVNLRDSIEKFVDIKPDVDIVYETPCQKAPVKLHAINNLTDYRLITYAWRDENGNQLSDMSDPAIPFNAHNGVGSFPISLEVSMDNGEHAIFYDTIKIDAITATYDTAGLRRSDTLFAEINGMNGPYVSFWNDIDDGAFLFASPSNYIPMNRLPINKQVVTLIVNANSNNVCLFLDTVTVAVHPNGPNTGIASEINNGLEVFPNPAANQINFSSLTEINRVEIYNVQGQFMESFEIHAKNGLINTTHLPSGYYLLKLNINNGTVVHRRMIIDQVR